MSIGKKIAHRAEAVKGAKKLILATDPDREGEAISWHVLEVLKQKKVLAGVAIERVAFNAVTKSAILEAIAHPRQIIAGVDVSRPAEEKFLERRRRTRTKRIDHTGERNLDEKLLRVRNGHELELVGE